MFIVSSNHKRLLESCQPALCRIGDRRSSHVARKNAHVHEVACPRGAFLFPICVFRGSFNNPLIH
eukprot:1342816-Amphidinium_carterae.1